VSLSHVLAPFTPFLAEELYISLTGGESVHLNDWQPAGHVDELSIKQMSRARGVIEVGLGLRMRKSDTEESVKVRQPLSKVVYFGEKLTVELEEIIADELNVKKVMNEPQDESKMSEDAKLILLQSNELTVYIDKSITPELHREGLVREVIRAVQSARKTAGLEIDDRITLALHATGELAMAIAEHAELIEEETLVSGKIEATLSDSMHDEVVQVEGLDLRVMLIKA